MKSSRLRKNQQDEPNLSFRNTRSRFYKTNQQSLDDSQKPKQNPEKSTGNYWKQQGNTEFRRGNLDKAIQYYSKAIQLTPSQCIYFCNRTTCYKLTGKFKEALKDAEQACELDPQNIKANYLCGCILAELGKYDKYKLLKAQNRLKKALRLCSSFKKTQFQDEISIKYYRLKKLMWHIQQKQQMQDLIVEKNLLQPNKTDQNTYIRVTQRMQKRLKQMQQFKTKKQIPDYLCCKITLELMEEPVTTEDGLTYEKSALQDHFRTNGFVQPISRNKLNTKPYPNLSLKNAIQDFLAQNPWAFEDGFEDSYLQIKF